MSKQCKYTDQCLKYTEMTLDSTAMECNGCPAKEFKRFYIDYRFIVDAVDEKEANKKVDALISEATDDVWYIIANVQEVSE